MSDPEPKVEQDGSNGSLVTMAEVCMAGTPPPQASLARDVGDRTNEAAQDDEEMPLEGGGRRRTSAFRCLELGGSSRQPLTREEQETTEAAE